MGVRQVVVLLDACRNDPESSKSAGTTNRLTDAYTGALQFHVLNRGVEAFLVWFATEKGKRSFENHTDRLGYFTQAVSEGLRGGSGTETTANARGEITLGSLLTYVQKKVAERTRAELEEQRPWADPQGFLQNELVLAKVALPRPGRGGIGTGGTPPPPPADLQEVRDLATLLSDLVRKSWAGVFDVQNSWDAKLKETALKIFKDGRYERLVPTETALIYRLCGTTILFTPGRLTELDTIKNALQWLDKAAELGGGADDLIALRAATGFFKDLVGNPRATPDALRVFQWSYRIAVTVQVDS